MGIDFFIQADPTFDPERLQLREYYSLVAGPIEVRADGIPRNAINRQGMVDDEIRKSNPDAYAAFRANYQAQKEDIDKQAFESPGRKIAVLPIPEVVVEPVVVPEAPKDEEIN